MRRHWPCLAMLLAVAVLLSTEHAQGVGLCGSFKTFGASEVLTAADLNSSFVQASTTNDTVQCTDDYSTNAAQMQTTTNPYPSGAESLATSLAGELERLRYQLGRLTVGSQLGTNSLWWYVTPIEGPRPNLLRNGSMENWDSGTTVAPGGWTLTGAGATIARDGTAGEFKTGTYSASVTRVGTDAYLSQSVPTLFGGNAAYLASRTYTLAVWVRAALATRARVSIWDGVAQTFSSYHTGGSTLELLTVTRTLSGSATTLDARLHVDTGNTTVQFDGVMLVEGYLAQSFSPHHLDTAIGARVSNSASQSIATSTATALSFDSERFDTSDLHGTAACSAANDKCRLYAPVAGTYTVLCSIQWASAPTTSQTSLRRNGTTNVAQEDHGNVVTSQITSVSRLAANDYMECIVQQTSGGALNVAGGSENSPEFALYYLGP